MSIERLTTSEQELQDAVFQVALSPEQKLQRLPRWQRVRLGVSLVIITMIWGGTFLVAQKTAQVSGPFTYLALCFGVGALTLALIFHKRLTKLTRYELFMGIIIGFFLFAGYALQTNGLLYTSASKSGFITGLYVPLVPLLSFVFLRQKPGWTALLGIVLSVIGLVLVSIDNSFNLVFGLGEILTLGCAVAFTMHIVCISKFVPRADAINLAIIQLALTSLLCFIAIPIAGEPLRLPSMPVLIVTLLVGTLDMAFCFFTMNRAQQYLSSTRATLIYALEPVWAGLFGFLAGQGLSLFAWFGCGCIFLGMIVGGVRFRALKKRQLNSAE